MRHPIPYAISKTHNQPVEVKTTILPAEAILAVAIYRALCGMKAALKVYLDKKYPGWR